jgi:DNA/RNA-binding domain of Phe-tRNA-synthetase-like protein
MYFQHSAEIWRDFPGLVPGVMAASGITASVPVPARTAELTAMASSRLAGTTESELPEIQAWRRAFGQLGLKPTQYRCASESLLRRYRKERSLPAIHPLVDLCNAISLAYAIPVAALDVDRIGGPLAVRPAAGTERYLAFSGEVEQPRPGEVIFADAAGNAHARRWTNRQSARSAIQPGSAAVFIVAEAMHSSGAADVAGLLATIAAEVAAAWPAAAATTAMLGPDRPRFETDPATWAQPNSTPWASGSSVE